MHVHVQVSIYTYMNECSTQIALGGHVSWWSMSQTYLLLAMPAWTRASHTYMSHHWWRHQTDKHSMHARHAYSWTRLVGRGGIRHTCMYREMKITLCVRSCRGQPPQCLQCYRHTDTCRACFQSCRQKQHNFINLSVCLCDDIEKGKTIIGNHGCDQRAALCTSLWKVTWLQAAGSMLNMTQLEALQQLLRAVARCLPIPSTVHSDFDLLFCGCHGKTMEEDQT